VVYAVLVASLALPCKALPCKACCQLAVVCAVAIALLVMLFNLNCLAVCVQPCRNDQHTSKLMPHSTQQPRRRHLHDQRLRSISSLEFLHRTLCTQ
jgi:hypothetical protein